MVSCVGFDQKIVLDSSQSRRADARTKAATAVTIVLGRLDPRKNSRESAENPAAPDSQAQLAPCPLSSVISMALILRFFQGIWCYKHFMYIDPV
jgi:hypothetical protein